MKIISVSLWGDNPRYNQGAIENANIAKSLFPEWRYRVYVGSTVPLKYKHQLSCFDNVDIVDIDETKNGYGMFWRFRPMFESDDMIMLCRDSDTRLLEREKKCVDEWLESGKKFSIIRDHPRHFDFPIIGTMWGMKGILQTDKLNTMKEYEKTFQYVIDQLWLANEIWPIAQKDCMIHELYNDSWFAKTRKQEDSIFVGQGYDENNIPIYPSW